MDRPENSAERLWRAESLVDLLGKMDLEKLPPHEGKAVGECQAKAMDEWLAAYVALRDRQPPMKAARTPRFAEAQ